MRSCLLAMWMSEAAGFDQELRETIYWAALLRYIGCTGHGKPPASASRRAQHPGGLSRREVEVLHLAAMGLTTKQISDRLFFSPKTADHYIQQVYTKIGVSTRGAAALWATQHAVVR
jgi:DNA-binding NarL/FixJ family response regulator